MDFLLKIVKWFKGHILAFDRKFILPVMLRIARFFQCEIDKRIQDETRMPDWKKDVMKGFKFWIEDLPNQLPEREGIKPDACDLYTLLSEFSALRQEIKLQNREQNRAVAVLDSFMGTYQDAVKLIKEKSQEIINLEERIRIATEKRTIIPFLDMRDALIRGYKASIEVSKIKGLFKSAPKGIEGITEGYEMALRRFDKALEMAGIQPVETIDKPFNSKTMKAVDKRYIPEKEKGLVIDEQASGFIRNEEVIRLAEVIVSSG